MSKRMSSDSWFFIGLFVFLIVLAYVGAIEDDNSKEIEIQKLEIRQDSIRLEIKQDSIRLELKQDSIRLELKKLEVIK